MFGKLRPQLVEKIWGGENLGKKKGSIGLRPIGESLEVSRLEGVSSSYESQSLDQILGERQLPYLVKLIETQDYLSVQVHPGDHYAREHENSSGKSECWVILSCEENSGIYLGFKHGVKSHDFFKSLNKGEDITDYLSFYPVKKGDFFYVPSGAVHAIGKGILLAEIQQSSGVTYRVWDWNRTDEKGNSRELHVSKAKDVLNFDSFSNQKSHFKIKSDVLKQDISLIKQPDFELQILKVRGKKNLQTKSSRVISTLVLEGQCNFFKEQKKLSLSQYESALLAGAGENLNIHIEGVDDENTLAIII